MSANPYMGDIAPFAFRFVPLGWQACDGSLLNISENDALFALIGTTYGGDGMTTFGVPDLRGRTPLGVGGKGGSAGSVALGEKGGSEQITLNANQLPTHNHLLKVTAGAASTAEAPMKVFAPTDPSFGFQNYGAAEASPTAPSNPNTLLPTGGATPVEMREPYVGINWCISLQGIFPQQP